MQTLYSAIISSPLGKLGLIVHDEKLNKINFLSDDTKVQLPNDKCSKQWVAELKHYFSHPTHCFQLAIQMKGTVFQQRETVSAMFYLNKSECVPVRTKMTTLSLGSSL